MYITKFLHAFGQYLFLMGRVFSCPERMRMFFKQYLKEMIQLGLNSIAIVLLISFFIGAVICIQIKLNIQSAWMPLWVSGYVTREIMLLEFSSSIMCLILSGKELNKGMFQYGGIDIYTKDEKISAMAYGAKNNRCKKICF